MRLNCYHHSMNLLLIFGGRSCEHAVSVISAQSVMKAITELNYQIQLIGITESGQWRWSGDDNIEALTSNGLVDASKGIAITPDLGSLGRFVRSDGEVVDSIDAIFPLLHGPFGEDGTIQGLFEMLSLPYVGCGVLASACGMDKLISKVLFEQADIPQADYVGITSSAWQQQPDALLDKIEQQLTFPLFIKPANMGSSVGVSKADNLSSLSAAIDHALLFDHKVLVENSFENVLEVECAVLGNSNPKASVVGEIKAGATFYDYDAKYKDDTSTVVIPAHISKNLSDKVRKLAVKAFQVIDGSGLARADFFIDTATEHVWINEINTLPGFTPISMYPKLWQATDLPYAQLIAKLVSLAIARFELKNTLKNSYSE